MADKEDRVRGLKSVQEHREGRSKMRWPPAKYWGYAGIVLALMSIFHYKRTLSELDRMRGQLLGKQRYVKTEWEPKWTPLRDKMEGWTTELAKGPAEDLVEKDAIQAVSDLKERLERAHREVEVAQRGSDLQRAAELLYGEIPAIEAELADAEQRTDGNAGFLQEEVTAEDIASVVARWTGIPVSRLLEGEVEKLIHMEQRLHDRVIGQDEAVRASCIEFVLAGLYATDRISRSQHRGRIVYET